MHRYLENKNDDMIDVAKNITTAIKAHDLQKVMDLIKKYPILAHHELNSDQQTALILAAESGANDIATYLLSINANVTHVDIKGLTAMNYAAFHHNESLHNLLELSQDKIKEHPCNILIDNLLKKIIKHPAYYLDKKEDSQPSFYVIYSSILEYLSRYSENRSSPKKLLDLYCLSNMLLHIASSANTTKELENNIMTLFHSREDLLCGDSEDYSYSDSLANQLCYHIAKQLFPGRNPTSVLLENAATKDREIPWQNPYTLESDLPTSPADFFRTSFNQIHLYEGVIERAIAQMKIGVKEKTKIWLGTDQKKAASKNRSARDEKEMPVESLSEDDINILSQRTPTFKIMIEFSKSLAMEQKKETLFNQLSKLYEGLSNGSSEGYATSSSHEAIAKFTSCWNGLNTSTQDSIKKIDIRLNDLINKILYHHDYCTVIASHQVHELLSSEIIRAELNKIDSIIDILSNKQLDTWKTIISSELKTTYPITTKKNIFSDLCQNDSFLNLCQEIDYIDYRHLILFVELLKSTPRSIIEKSEIIHTIFSIEDTYTLKTLYDFYNKKGYKNDSALFAALSLKLCSKNIISFHTLLSLIRCKNILNELLYYAVYTNQLKLIHLLLELGASPNETSSQYHNLFLDVGYQCDVKCLISNKWFAATVLERKGNQVLIHYDQWNSFFDAWININRPLHLAAYKTHSVTSDQQGTLALDNITPSLLFEMAYKNKRPDIAIALTEYDKSCFQQSILLTAASEDDWSFVYQYFTQLKSNEFKSPFLQDMLENAIQANRHEIVPILVKRGAKLHPDHLQIAFKELQSPILIASLLTADEKFESEEILLAGAAEQNWSCVSVYLSHRPAQKNTLSKLLAYAVQGNNPDKVKELLNYLKDDFSPDNSYFDTGFMCDVNISGKWVKGKVLYRIENTVRIACSEGVESINFQEFPQRFAMYGSYSENHHDKNYLLALENVSFPLFEIAFRNNYAEIANLLTQSPRLIEMAKNTLLKASSSNQWELVRRFISLNKSVFDVSFLQELFDRAIITNASESVTFLKEQGVSITPHHLQIAFRAQQPFAVASLLLSEQKLEDNKLLLSETKKGNWPCVLAYLKIIKPNNQTLNLILRCAVMNNKAAFLKSLINDGINPAEILLIAKNDECWQCINHLIKLINNASAPFNSDFPIDFNEKRSCAYDFVNYVISKETDPHKLVSTMNALFEMEEKNPLLIQRAGHISTIRGHQWNKKNVSHAWTNLISNAKRKVLEISSAANENSDDITTFLNTPTARFTAVFYKSTSSFNHYNQRAKGSSTAILKNEA